MGKQLDRQLPSMCCVLHIYKHLHDGLMRAGGQRIPLASTCDSALTSCGSGDASIALAVRTLALQPQHLEALNYAQPDRDLAGPLEMLFAGVCMGRMCTDRYVRLMALPSSRQFGTQHALREAHLSVCSLSHTPPLFPLVVSAYVRSSA